MHRYTDQSPPHTVPDPPKQELSLFHRPLTMEGACVLLKPQHGVGTALLRTSATQEDTFVISIRSAKDRIDHHRFTWTGRCWKLYVKLEEEKHEEEQPITFSTLRDFLNAFSLVLRILVPGIVYPLSKADGFACTHGFMSREEAESCLKVVDRTVGFVYCFFFVVFGYSNDSQKHMLFFCWSHRRYSRRTRRTILILIFSFD